MKRPAASEKSHLILVLNLGSTSTKLAVYRDDEAIVTETAHHSQKEIAKYRRLANQIPMRQAAVLGVLQKARLKPENLDAVAARGGIFAGCEAGVYRVGPRMLDDARSNRYGTHASNLGVILAHEIADAAGIPAFTVSPPTVDELCAEARFSGIRQIVRRPIWHALNQKRAAEMIAARMGKQYQQVNLIVAHLGGGISVAAHRRGKAIEVNNALDGDGPFGIERSGGLPAADLVRLARRLPDEEILGLITGRGGVVDYLGTNDMRAVERMITEGDEKARGVINAMAWQVSKEIGACAAALNGKVDAVVLTGSLARWKYLVGRIRSHVRFIAPIKIVPGEMEVEALAKGALDALLHKAVILDYPKVAAE